MNDKKRENCSSDVGMLLTVLKRCGATKKEAVAALQDATRIVGRDGLAGEGSEVRELYGILSLRFILEDENFQFKEEGGVSTAEEFGALLGGLSASTVHRRRREGGLIGFRDRRSKRYLYPNYQVESGAILNGIAECLALYREYGMRDEAKILATRLLSPLTASSGACERGVDHLRAGKPEKALELLKTDFSRR